MKLTLAVLLFLTACGVPPEPLLEVPYNSVDCDNYQVTHQCTVEFDEVDE